MTIRDFMTKTKPAVKFRSIAKYPDGSVSGEYSEWGAVNNIYTLVMYDNKIRNIDVHITPDGILLFFFYLGD